MENEFCDYYNFNLNLKDFKEMPIKIMGTTFANNVYYIKDDYAKTWSVDLDKFTGRNSKGNKGIDCVIRYSDGVYQATVNAQGEIVTKKGKIYINDSDYREAPVSRCIDGYFKVSAGGDFTAAIGDYFWATRLAKRMASKGDKIDLGETMTARVCYGVLKGEPKIVIDIIKLNSMEEKSPKPESIRLGNLDIPYNFCKTIEEKFNAEHICMQPDETGTEIKWSEPTDWIYPDKQTDKARYDAAFQIKYGVYMWIGVKESEPENKYLYIGIVGTDRNKENTIGNRIFNQEMKNGIGFENGITKVECFRYSELKNSGELSANQVLCTVEMQCINNFSSFFGYNDLSLKTEPEKTIHNIYEGITIDGKSYSLKMLNKRKRYNNS